MSLLFDTLSCCWFWLLLGILIGWLLNWLLCRYCCKANSTSATENIAADTTPQSVAASAPAASPAPLKTAISEPVAFDLASAKANGFTIKVADDLTVIEGIGPKISALFKSNGLGTFALVAAASVETMRAVLDKGGARFRIANPSTWAQQASLAANNKWAELKKLQDALSGGVKK